MKRRWVPTIGPIIVVVALTACSSPESSAGPLLFGGDQGALCVPVAPGSSAVVGDVIQAPASGDVTVEHIDLVNPTGLEVGETFVVQLRDGLTSLGAAAYPPIDDEIWAARQRAEGTVIPAGQSANVLVVITRAAAADSGSAAAMRVTYRGPDEHQKANSTTYSFDDRCA